MSEINLEEMVFDLNKKSCFTEQYVNTSSAAEQNF